MGKLLRRHPIPIHMWRYLCQVGSKLALVAVAWMFLFGQPLLAGPAPGPDAFGYTVQPTTNFNFVQITNGSPRVLVLQDDTAITVGIGFTFSFYGSNYANVSFNPNGLMTFGGQSTAFSNINLTTIPPPTNLPCIAVLWDDWEAQSPQTDGVYYKTTGAAGSRQFFVQWNKVAAVNGDGTNTVTFQARLFEGSGKILFSYFDVVVSDETTLPPNAASLGVGATVGIRDLSGETNNHNLQWSFNQAVITNGLNLLFSPPNHPPVANNDTAVTPEDTPVTIAVKANDTDADGDVLTLLSVTQGTNGLVTTNAGGTVTYSPATNFFGVDHFTYVINDGQGGSATGLVTVTVTPVNDPPIAGTDSVNAYQNTSLTISNALLLANDTDVDGDALTITGVSQSSTAGGGVSLTSSVITYTPPPDFTGSDSFTYTVADGHGGTATGAVSVTVWPLPAIGSVASQPSGSVRLGFQGIPSGHYTIEASSDLTTWNSVGTASEESPGEFVFEDPAAAGAPARFYRLRWP